jgi:hypothetical protein
MFLRRIGQDPHASVTQCMNTSACPDIWELEDGDFAVIGKDITAVATAKLPASAGCGADERIIRVPRNLLVSAKRNIPDKI